MHEVEPGIEIASMADIPSGTGLGSSGTFTVGLLRALHALKRRAHRRPRQLAEEACRLEIDLLSEPVGKQDQYIAAFGGLTCFEFHPDESVEVDAARDPRAALHELEEHLLLFFTGYSRSASSILDDQTRRARRRATRRCSSRWSSPRSSACGSRPRSRRATARAFAKLMNEHWEYKRQRSPGHVQHDDRRLVPHRPSTTARSAASSSAPAPAGSCCSTPRTRRRCGRRWRQQGLAETRFRFDFDGSVVLARG